ncbi:MAG: T9SS type A sorting domain-containing protein [Bacteroidales bacterium]|nr:T9SS type A sorting domain-containing protein [Bacteroidales bacterium]MCF8388765.1 T9SS type A sorting domain-containing protein [Bacteroidales bacterium]MCF8399160.1 T9SS type A sorting domain-containing protein [Bacteroidales bacterium]
MNIICQNDTASTTGGMEVNVNVLTNDENTGSDTIYVFGAWYKSPIKGGVWHSDSIVSVVPFMNHNDGTDTIIYRVAKKNTTAPLDTAYLIVHVINSHSYDSLCINNINAGVNSFNYLFGNMGYLEKDHRIDFENVKPHFEVPKGSGKHTIFACNLWVGGMNNGEIYFAGERYRQPGPDFYTGPVSEVYDSLYFAKWGRTWKVSQEEISYHISHCNDPGYEPIEVIRNWPGNGNPDLGQSLKIAPFCDYNSNEKYEPELGDYPLIRGDEAIFYVFNDSKYEHYQSGGSALGIEGHIMVYGYDDPDDSVLQNTIFVHFDIVNKSNNRYNNTYAGLNFDGNLGYNWDDYVGCNVNGGYFYTCNGDSLDENIGNINSYGLHPPAQSATFLAGPLKEADNLDNPYGECDESINGLGFGDNVIDNERLGMTGWLYYLDNHDPIVGIPSNDSSYYNYLRMVWKDNTRVMYGGNGHPLYGSTEIPAKFMYPGDSDTCFWGTGGIHFGGEPWTEFSVGNPPSDRRSVGSTGPFTFESGETVELDMAFVFARDYNGNHLDALPILEERNANLKEKVKNSELIYLPDCSPSSVEEHKHLNQIHIYPNPAKEYVIINTSQNNSKISIYDLTGKVHFKGLFIEKEVRIDLNFLENGFYLVVMDDGIMRQTSKLIKL